MRGPRQEGFPQSPPLQKLRGPAMPGKRREDPVRSQKHAILDLGGVTFTSMGTFKSWHLCPLRSVVSGKCMGKMPLSPFLEILSSSQGTGPPDG